MSLQQQAATAADQLTFQATEVASAMLRVTADQAKVTALDGLLRAQVELETMIALCRVSLEIVRSELRGRTAANLDAAIDAAKKQSGTFNFTHDGMPLKAEIDKEVKWDTEQLMPIAGSMPWNVAQKIFKFEISVPEKIYASLPATMSVTPELTETLKKIEAARMVKYGKAKITARI